MWWHLADMGSFTPVCFSKGISYAITSASVDFFPSGIHPSPFWTHINSWHSEHSVLWMPCSKKLSSTNCMDNNSLGLFWSWHLLCACAGPKYRGDAVIRLETLPIMRLDRAAKHTQFPGIWEVIMVISYCWVRVCKLTAPVLHEIQGSQRFLLGP